MQFKTFSLPHITCGYHEDRSAKLFVLSLSVDLHHSYSAKGDMTEAVYAEALLSGAGTYTREAFLDAVNKTGGAITAAINASILTIGIRCEITKAPTLLKLLSAILTEPAFSETELARIRKNLHNDLELEKENARNQAHSGLKNVLFGATDRRHTATIETLQKSLGTVTNADVAKLHERTRSEAWTVTMSGTPASLASAKKMLTAAKGDRVPQAVTGAHEPRELASRVIVTEHIPSKHNVELSIGGPLPLTMHHPDFLPFVFGLAVLGKWGGFAGRLMSTVREKEGLTYSIYARTEGVMQQEAGHWRVMTFFAPDKTMTGIASTLREITAIAKKGVTDKEMERFRAILKTQQLLLNDSLLSSLSDLHGYLLAGFTLDEMVEYKARLLAVTKKEVNEALKKYLNPERLVISAAGPVAAIKKELDTFRSV